MAKTFCFIIWCLFAVCGITQAQEKLSEKERLTQEMYTPNKGDSAGMAHFMEVTERLKTLALRDGDEELFYKAWSNQATMTFAFKSFREGMEIAEAESAYARSHGSKTGIVAASGSIAMMQTHMKLYDQAEHELLQLLDYMQKNCPDESTAFECLSLQELYLDKGQYDKVQVYADKVLADPKARPDQIGATMSYLCLSIKNQIQANDTEVLRRKFNEAYEKREQIKKKYGMTEANYEGAIGFYHALYNGRYNELYQWIDKLKDCDRMKFTAEAHYYNGRYKEAYELSQKNANYLDSIYSVENVKHASEYANDLTVARAESEAKDLKMKLLGWELGAALLIICFMAFYLWRRHQQMRKLKNAYDQLEEVTTQKERMESELRIARDIQMSMVPGVFPDRPDLDLSASMTPAREVGGDLYGYLLQGDVLYFCVGDVSGKGVPASLFMAQAARLFRTLAARQLMPAELTTQLNEALAEGNEGNMFVTMFIGRADLTTGRLDFCNAGHPTRSPWLQP